MFEANVYRVSSLKDIHVVIGIHPLSLLTMFVYCTDEIFTVEDAIEACGFGWFQIKLSVFAGLVWVSTDNLNNTYHMAHEL